MSSQILGVTYDLLLGTTAASKTEITGIASGLDAITDTKSTDTQPISGGGAGGATLGNHETLGFGVRAIPADDTTDPLLAAAHAQRRYFTARKRGTGAGLTEMVGECVLQVSLSGQRQQAILLYAVTAAIDGDPTTANQA